MRNALLLPILAAALTLAPAAALAHHEGEEHDAHDVPDKLGHVDFAVTCTPEVRPTFERGVALLHSFAYGPAEQAFADVAAHDPACGMAQWGRAMSYFHVIWGPSTADEFAAGRAAAQQALKIGGATARERDYIAAINAFYAGDAPHAVRVAAFSDSMTALAARYPDDHEAQIFHALAILGVAYNSPPDKSYARQKQAAEILNRELAANPEHPGIAHYMIHAFDYPELAQLALPAARAYAKIAPSAPHALHMPSHIFTRLGMWQESIQSNLASVAAANAWAAKSKPGTTPFEALHAMDYLEYAYLQSGQDAKAREVADQVAKAANSDPIFSAGYALAAVPARYALERHAWKDAAALEVTPANFPWNQYAYAEAIFHFARAVGGARSGDLATAREGLARLTAIQAALQGQKGFDWATQVEIQRRAAAAWIAHAEDKDDEALTTMRSAAELEESTDKHPVTPGSVLPAREMLGDLLLETGRPKDAFAAYEQSLRSAPARFNSYQGATLAAERAGMKPEARSYHDKLVALCGGTVPARTEDTKKAAR
jgi:tetratricopeptide (TPR) repeat protein